MPFLRPYRIQSGFLRTGYCPLLSNPLRARFASGYGNPSNDAHPVTSNPQGQGSSTQQKQAERPGPRESEPSKQGGSSYGDEGQDTKADAAPTDTKSSRRASEASWEGNGSPGGSRVHGSEKKKTKLGGSLSMNKDKNPDPTIGDGLRGNPMKGDMKLEGQEDGKDARDVGGKDDARKQS